MTLSVVIPVFNGELSLTALVKRLRPVLDAAASDWEVVFVNDGSADRSWQAIDELCRSDPRIRGVNLMRNYGQHSALLCGIRQTRLETLITMDDDLQNPPEEIPRLLEKLNEGWDVVYGSPVRGNHGFLRNMASTITKIALQKAMGAETARKVSAFRVFRGQLRGALLQVTGPFVNLDVLLTWGSTRFTSVPVRMDPRFAGKSNYTFWKLVRHAMNMLTGFTTLPLQAAGILGFVLAATGGMLTLFVLTRYALQGSAVPGFTFLASVITLFSGAQLFAIGVIGEYLGRVHFRTMDQPSYVIRSFSKGPDRAPSSPAPDGSGAA